MKKIILSVMLLIMIVSTFARASDTFLTNINVTSNVLSAAAQKSNLCYQLSAQGKTVREEVTDPAWFESTDDAFVWRISRLGAGLTCRELVQGRYNLQFGSGAQKMGCECIGAVEISK